MVDIAGVHRGVQYTATYRIDGEQTRWRGTFHLYGETFSREGQLIHGWMAEPDVHARVHVSIQLFIERCVLGESSDGEGANAGRPQASG